MPNVAENVTEPREETQCPGLPAEWRPCSRGCSPLSAGISDNMFGHKASKVEITTLAGVPNLERGLLFQGLFARLDFGEVLQLSLNPRWNICFRMMFMSIPVFP